MSYPKTIFLDIDGVLFEHTSGWYDKQRILPGSLQKVHQWIDEGHTIILTTARKECMRDITEKQLITAGFLYDMLIMNLPRGKRIVINDSKPNEKETALGIFVKRNEGLSDVEI